jgi:hypothetical protein
MLALSGISATAAAALIWGLCIVERLPYLIDRD